MYVHHSFIIYIANLYYFYIVSEYSFDIGFRFYYWDYYKEIDQYHPKRMADVRNSHRGYSPQELYCTE